MLSGGGSVRAGSLKKSRAITGGRLAAQIVDDGDGGKESSKTP